MKYLRLKKKKDYQDLDEEGFKTLWWVMKEYFNEWKSYRVLAEKDRKP